MFINHTVQQWCSHNLYCRHNTRQGKHKEKAYNSLYVSKAWFASTSSRRSRSLGTAPSDRGGSYLLLHGDLSGDKSGGRIGKVKKM